MKTLKEVLYQGTPREHEKTPFIIAEMSGRGLKDGIAIMVAGSMNWKS